MSRTSLEFRIVPEPRHIDAAAWNALLARQAAPTPFMRHEYLTALHASGSATARTGWEPAFATLWDNEALVAACPLYLKSHSYGEYVFDWAWANAYEQHGVPYYPKALVAVPFTPVPGARLMAVDAPTRLVLVQALLAWASDSELSSLHLLFGEEDDIAACEAADLMRRHTVQFHWENRHPAPNEQGRAYRDFDDFLAALNQEKRKKIRQERRKVAGSGVRFRWARGADIQDEDWDFFYRCYARTYREHGNPPYLTRDFFRRMATSLPEAWLLFVAERDGHPMACSLIGLGADADGRGVAYGRYWGALERVDCLHFEACYYQPIEWCIANQVHRFEGGAQGEHKMARALMPVMTTSVHWLAHPAFADAVERFLEREGEGVSAYVSELGERTPFRS